MKKIHHIDKNLLYQYYIIDNMMKHQVANIFGCSKTTISRKVKEYGIVKQKPQKIMKKCEYCGKIVWKKPSTVRKHSYCSYECFYYHSKKNKTVLGMYNGGKIKTNCSYCNKVIYRFPSSLKLHKKHFCCRKCMGKWQSENWVGKNSVNYQNKKKKS